LLLRWTCIVKEGKRHRYIGFLIQGLDAKDRVERRAMIQSIHTCCQQLYGMSPKEMGMYLTRFNGHEGILRCSHLEKEHAIALLKSIRQLSGDTTVHIETLGTSGTINKLIKKHMSPALKDHHPPHS
jgi:RNase P/RNase MRP subunit POP5